MKRVWITTALLLVAPALLAEEPASQTATTTTSTAAVTETAPPPPPAPKGTISVARKSNPKAPAEEAKPDDSTLVKAAKSGDKKKSRIKINDADVKKTTGKLSIVSAGPEPKPVDPAYLEADAKLRQTEQEKLDQERKRAAERTARIERAEKDVAKLELELKKLEDDFYTEDDPDFREEVIEQRFAETKKALDKARQELTAARNATQGDPQP